MKQPDLGKKISELRLAKGLTQRELADRCNLSLRTIQRIESAEVMPRSYTIKLIFECLDYKIYNSFGKLSYKLDRTAYRIKAWLEQFYKYVLDLFNLKTKTMKKITILLTPILMIGLFIFMSFSNSNNHDLTEAQLKFEQLASTFKYIEWFNSGNIDSICARYMDNAWAMPDNSPAIYGIDKIKEDKLDGYNRGVRFIELKSIYSAVSDSIGIDRGEWIVSVNNLIVSGFYLTQYRYLNGKWLIENEMSKTEKIHTPD